jgi:hypothetical protein
MESIVPCLAQHRSEQSAQDQNGDRTITAITGRETQSTGNARRQQRVTLYQMSGLKLRADRFSLAIDLAHGLLQAFARLFQLALDSVDIVFHFGLPEPGLR